jgi:hypothetical protein
MHLRLGGSSILFCRCCVVSHRLRGMVIIRFSLEMFVMKRSGKFGTTVLIIFFVMTTG